MQDEDPYANQKYSFYEIVIIDSKKEHLSQYNGRRGFIEGKLDLLTIVPAMTRQSVTVFELMEYEKDGILMRGI